MGKPQNATGQPQFGTNKNNWYFSVTAVIIWSMKHRQIHPIPILLLSGILLALLALLFVIVGASCRRACTETDGIPRVTQEPIYTPAPTLVDLYAYYDRTETTEIRVYDHRADKLITMDLEAYVLGVVSGEMPVRYGMEALKAQAVATRTYTLYRAAHGGCHTRDDADVCTNSKCCQAFSSHASMQQKWGDAYAENYNRLAEAVMSTAGQVLMYDGKLCDALYHACSGGRTEDSENVYSNMFPYLRGVDSPYEDPMREKDVAFGAAELVALITAKYPDCGVTEENYADEIAVESTYESGRVRKFRIGRTEISGKEANKLFDLKTAMFTVTASEDGLVFHTKGYGHGVGLSQNGANGMAAHGSTYEEILLHYYTGVDLVSFDAPEAAPAAQGDGLPLVPED